MTDPIRPIRPISGVSRIVRVGAVSGARSEAAPEPAEPELNLPAIIATPVREEPEAPKVSETAYAAQVMGQGGQKRGLRGGKETLDRARATYLGTEYSGPADRRLTTGKITKTEI
jgi:hypothetical protein